MTADLVLDGDVRGIDIAPLAVTRFEGGTPLWEPLTAYAGTHGRPNA